MTADEAKKFLSKKIQETALNKGIDFDDLEKRMLLWSSNHEDLELGEEFSKKHNDQDYEKKVKKMLLLSYEYDREQEPGDLGKYKEASKALHQGDHYLSIMLDQSLRHTDGLPKWIRFGGESSSLADYLSLIAVGLIFFVVFFIWFLIRIALSGHK